VSSQGGIVVFKTLWESGVSDRKILPSIEEREFVVIMRNISYSPVFHLKIILAQFTVAERW
jgi:hypothetical protein